MGLTCADTPNTNRYQPYSESRQTVRTPERLIDVPNP